jgi:hypothetical protein
VAKLEEPIKFLILEKRLTLDHLSTVWQCQLGKHETIVNNIYDLLAKLAWHFETQQLDRLFELFQKSWGGSLKEMERLLEFIRKLAEDDTVMSVLGFSFFLSSHIVSLVLFLSFRSHAWTGGAHGAQGSGSALDSCPPDRDAERDCPVCPQLACQNPRL